MYIRFQGKGGQQLKFLRFLKLRGLLVRKRKFSEPISLARVLSGALSDKKKVSTDALTSVL